MTVRLSPRAISASVTLVCFAVYAFLSFFYPFGNVDYAGQYVYDYYYNGLLDGRLDIPVRLIGYEGHYLKDGTAYTYHGLAPLLTRFAFGWLLPTDGSFFPYASPLLWCAIGSASCHTILHKLTCASARDDIDRNFLLAAIGVLAWLVSPGLFLAGNASLYVEPIAVAYATTAVFFLLVVLHARGEASFAMTIIICSLCVAIALHARPHVAVGLSLGLGILGIRALFQCTLRRVLTLVCGACLIGLSGAGYLYVNYLKFGDPMQAHAGFSPDNEVQMGTVFLGLEEYGSQRADGFEEHGRFNPARIPGTLLAYTLDLPNPNFHSGIERALEMQEPVAGFVRLEPPFLGILPLWAVWFLVIAMGLRSRPTWHQAVLIAAGGAIAVMILSYPTVTFRYRAELWPLVMALMVISLPNFLAGFDADNRSTPRRNILIAGAVSLLISVNAATAFAASHRNPDGRYVLDREECVELVGQRFDPDDTARLCADWKKS